MIKIKTISGFISLSFATSIFLISFVFFFILNSVPTVNEINHQNVISKIRNNNFSVASLNECESENTKITKVSDTLYKVTTKYKTQIPILQYSRTEEKISYLNSGD